MKTLLLSSTLLLGACTYHASYVLPDHAPDGESRSYQGTVLSVDKDGDFLMETGGRLLFVDADDLPGRVEQGERIHISGTIDNDTDDAEAPELDADDIVEWEK